MLAQFCPYLTDVEEKESNTERGGKTGKIEWK
jgi:hypothetical protein